LSTFIVIKPYNHKAKWAGPCDAMQTMYKRFKTEFGDQLTYHQVILLNLLKALSDGIDIFVDFRNKSCPAFLFYYVNLTILQKNDTLVKIVRGANAPLLDRTIREQLQIVKDGGVHSAVYIDELKIDSSFWSC
jgi:hypothetical protein